MSFSLHHQEVSDILPVKGTHGRVSKGPYDVPLVQILCLYTHHTRTCPPMSHSPDRKSRFDIKRFLEPLGRPYVP